MRVVLRRITYFLRQRRQESELLDELEFHRAMLERELADAGTDPDDARTAAQRRLGNHVSTREWARDVWIAPWVQDLGQDMRFAARVFWKERAFTAVAALALGLGIGVNNALFTIVNAYCLRGLPIAEPDRTVFISTRDANGQERGLTLAEFEALRRSTGTVTQLGAYSTAPASLRDADRAPDRVQAAYVSADGLATLGVAPVKGRLFRREEDEPGAPAVAILGYTVWQSRYGGDPAIVGTSVVVNGSPVAVIGVLQKGFGFPGSTDLWRPLGALPHPPAAPSATPTLGGVFGRLRHGATVTEARAELETLGRRALEDGGTSSDRVRATVVPINERFVGKITDPAWLAFMSAGLLVLLIACANVGNLLLARAVGRSREIAIRASVGATRGRIVRQMLVESFCLAVLGSILGLAVARLGIHLLVRAIPEVAIPFWLDFSIDVRVFMALVTVCVGTVFAFGLVPALQVASTKVHSMTTGAARGPVGGRQARRWATAFLVAEFALTMVLLAGVGRTVRAILEQPPDPVADPEHLVTAVLSLPAERYATAERRADLYARVEERLKADSDVAPATVASTLSLNGGPQRRIVIDGRESVQHVDGSIARVMTIGDRYFQALGVKLVAGRPFESADSRPGQPAVIVNQRFVDLYVRNGRPLGTRVRIAGQTGEMATAPWLAIVGVAPSFRLTPTEPADPMLYLPYRLDPPASMTLLVRTAGDTAGVAARLRDEVRALDRDLPLVRVHTLSDARAEAGWNGRVSAGMISIIAAIALCLALVGLYAVTAHAVSRRTHEIGVRMALGATRTHVAATVLSRAMGQIAGGVVAGTVCTVAWDRAFGAVGTQSLADPPAFAAVALTVTAVALLACLMPARRAARVDPCVALRFE